MAIKDRTRRSLPRLGIIRLGIQVPNKRGNGTHPEQAGRFVLRDAPEVEAFYADQGIEEVRELDVLLPFKDIDSNFTAFYQVWAGGVLVCKGDGEYVQYATPFTVTHDKKGTHVYNAPGDTRVNDGVAQVDFDWNGEHFAAGDFVPCPGKRRDFYPHCKACRLNCILKVSMADENLFRFGYYQISTQGQRNHDTIMGTLEMMPTNRVNGIPFKLRMIQAQTTFQDTDGQRKKTKRWFLQLEPDPTITRQLYRRAVSQMIGAPQEQETLPELVDGIDWDEDVYDADPPAPPPFAEVQIVEPAPEDTKAAPPIELVPMPTGISGWDSFFQCAMDKLEFSNVGAVKSALLSIFGAQWKADAKIADAWVLLQEYQHAQAD